MQQVDEDVRVVQYRINVISRPCRVGHGERRGSEGVGVVIHEPAIITGSFEFGSQSNTRFTHTSFKAVKKEEDEMTPALLCEALFSLTRFSMSVLMVG